MLKSVMSPAVALILSISAFACHENSTSQNKSLLFDPYLPTESERLILSRGLDPTNPSAKKSICIQDAVVFEKGPISTLTYSMGLVSNQGELARRLGVDLDRPESTLLISDFFIDVRDYRRDFVKKSSMDATHVYFMAATSIRSYFIRSSHELMTEDALKLIHTPAFEEQCGTHFYSGMGYGGEQYALLDFTVPAGANQKEFGLMIQGHFINATTDELFANHIPQFQFFQKGGRTLSANANAVELWKNVQSFQADVVVQPAQLGTSFQDYYLLDNYPWEAL